LFAYLAICSLPGSFGSEAKACEGQAGQPLLQEVRAQTLLVCEEGDLPSLQVTGPAEAIPSLWP